MQSDVSAEIFWKRWFVMDELFHCNKEQIATQTQAGTWKYWCYYWEVVEGWQKAICYNWTNDVNARVNLLIDLYAIMIDVIRATNHNASKNNRCPNCSKTNSQSKLRFVTDAEQIGFQFSERFFTSWEKKNAIGRNRSKKKVARFLISRNCLWNWKWR
jgi:hypothetical protein